ncbi:cytochrome P450 [Fomitopsis serialis]|uniref:cytochrome P450 n=1 Tax=Fomitopsis serialis TaxID=139415 RepID=UPI00200781D7|nr:cytochrome P450 [Neoantrodia serialis]KAH9916523.1 cytochrome P450 [Neoantrodia serialis]
MSITLNRFPVLPTHLYPEDMLARPSASVAGFISGFRHSVLESPTVIACIAVNLMMLYYIFAFFMKKNSIPAVGYPSWLGPWAGAIRFFYDSKRIINEGYRKYKGRTFRVPLWNEWTYIVTDQKCIDEMYHLPDDVLSLRHAAGEELQLPYTMGQQIEDNPYHLPVLRGRLTRHIEYLVKECLDELPLAIEDDIGKLCGDQWTEMNAFDVLTGVIARTFNRILVGAPTCRSAHYTETCKSFAMKTSIVGFIINLFPFFLQPIVGRMITQLPSQIKRSLHILAPIIAERQAAMAEYGKHWLEKPTDLLMWLMESADTVESQPERLAIRILVINIATIHTTAASFVHAINNLLEYPEFIVPLREEAEAAIGKHGFTKNAMNAMPFSDSFFKESSRMNALGTSGEFPRKAMKDITFSDGTTVPAGSYISSPFCVHYDEEFYPDPLKFEPARHMQETLSSGVANNSSGMFRTNPHYLIFGHGKFLATYILKATMAYLLLNYDIKPSSQGRASDILFQYNNGPNIRSSFMIRRRKMA